MRMKDIPGQEGKYAITDDGRVWCHGYTMSVKSRWGFKVTKRWKPHWIATNSSKDGKWYISVAIGGKNRKGYKIHRLMAQAFIPNPKGLKEINHKNGIKTDNRLENLEWCTRKNNMKHARDNGFIPPAKKGADRPNAKLTWEQAEEIRREYSENRIPHRKLCLRYGVSFATVGDIVRNKRYIKKDALDGL